MWLELVVLTTDTSDPSPIGTDTCMWSARIEAWSPELVQLRERFTVKWYGVFLFFFFSFFFNVFVSVMMIAPLSGECKPLALSFPLMCSHTKLVGDL